MPLNILKLMSQGRGSIKNELAKVRREAIRKNGYRSFVSGVTEDLEGHHGFDVTTYPMFALRVWNLWMMTQEEHAAYHKWNGGTQKSCTPVSLYIWVYFVRKWWWGYASLLLGFAVFMILNWR